MLNYYLKLALISFKRAPTLYFLVILTLSVGVGLVSANLALVNTMVSDPIPEKSHNLLHVSVNNWPNEDPPQQPFHLLRYRDAKAVLDANIGKRATMFYETGVYARDADSTNLKRFDSSVRATTPDFFELTNAPFAYGTSFKQSTTKEVVIGHELNQKIFDGQNSVGKTLELDGNLLTIVGVLKPWNLRPLFYHATENRAFNKTEDLFAPIETAIDLGWSVHGRSMSTVEYRGIEHNRNRNVFFLQAWVEVEGENQKRELQNYLDNYSQGLKDNGEHPLEVKNELHNVNEWLTKLKIVEQKVLAFTLASVLFLCVCIFNASSLLLSRFHAAKFEVGLRRAIGASNKHMLVQGLVESLVVGVIAAIVSLLLSWMFLSLSSNFLPALSNMAVLDAKIFFLCVALAFLTSIVSALYPLYRANRYTISAELK